jgi:hypothetical protein
MAIGSTLQPSGTAGMANSDEMNAGQRRHSVTHDETKVCAFAARRHSRSAAAHNQKVNYPTEKLIKTGKIDQASRHANNRQNGHREPFLASEHADQLAS